jgi:hypothetical protein
LTKISKLFSNIKATVSCKLANTQTSFKTRIKNGVETLQKSFEEAKKKPVSRIAFLLGFETVTSLVGVTLFATMLPTIGKYMPKNQGKPDGMVPTTPAKSSTLDIILSRKWG